MADPWPTRTADVQRHAADIAVAADGALAELESKLNGPFSDVPLGFQARQHIASIYRRLERIMENDEAKLERKNHAA